MRVRILAIVLFVSLAVQAWDWWPLPMAQPDSCRDTLQYEVGVAITAGSGRYNAFWMQSGQRGLGGVAPFSGALRAMIEKPTTCNSRWYDYDFAVDLQAMVHSALPVPNELRSKSLFPIYQGEHGRMMVHRLYAHARLYIVDVSAGVMPLDDGMNVPLGSGSLLFSNNAPSMPLIRIGFDRWTPIPGLYGYLEIKGGLVQAWLTDNIGVNKSMMHYKWIGVQAGGKLPVNISYEFHHAAQWGGYSAEGRDLGNNLHAFKNVFIAHSGGDSYNEQYNAQGNHVGSQQLAVTAKGEGWQAKVYWQNFLEDNFAFLGQGHNLPDGRWGVCAQQRIWPFINTLTFEYINTTDQSGPLHDQDGVIYAGRDNYYNNGVYLQGWNYYLQCLGTPLVMSPLYNKEGQGTLTLNNRVQAWHLGIGGDIYGFTYRLLATHMRNYGLYQYDDWFTMKSHNTSLLLQVNKHVEQAWGLDFGISLAADLGTQWDNPFSAQVTVSKKGLLTNW
ncbi:MAG: hypothetical protein J5884_06465 [Paludibacteraceae bacterium]|nr:hypothetical protein [Paludibacteraceae bacterium]